MGNDTCTMMTIISMYHSLQRYMLTSGGIRDIDACVIIDNRNDRQS